MNFLILLFISISFSQYENCINYSNDSINNRTVYSIGDTLSIEDQNVVYNVCNGSGDYQTGDTFSFLDLNGDQNGGHYKVILISMNATW